MEQEIVLNLDSDGLVVQLDGDGGDCAARTGELYTFLHNNPSKVKGLPPFFSALAKLCEPGFLLTRYTKFPYRDVKDIPGDQTVPMIVAAGFEGQSMFILAQKKAIAANYSRFPNNDVCSFQHWGAILRGLEAAFGNTVELSLLNKFRVLIGDVEHLFNSVIRVLCSYVNFDKWSGDCINHAVLSYQATQTFSTPISWLSRKFFSKLLNKGVQATFDHYHGTESGGNIGIAKLAAPVIKEWFS